MSAAPLLYFEDYPVGTVIPLGSRTVSKEEIIAFAAAFDPQPFHLDEEAGRNSFLGGLCASGWHTCAMVHRLNVDAFMSKVHSLGSPGGDELKWIKPLFPGDTLTATSTILEARPSASRPSVGIVRLLTEASNQNGEPILRMRASVMLGRRPAA